MRCFKEGDVKYYVLTQAEKDKLDAITNIHSHNNLALLEKLSIDAESKLLYNNIKVDTTLNATAGTQDEATASMS